MNHGTFAASMNAHQAPMLEISRTRHQFKLEVAANSNVSTCQLATCAPARMAMNLSGTSLVMVSTTIIYVTPLPFQQYSPSKESCITLA